ncbi:hypothetical protein AVEN_70258-1 [Araneus ventricosus]|uniref:Uncharacterized protein n=1 Tax=Araneus ventricosus TaxID=182803 RepID=A0A4Y2GCX4_ARAVE|nr:hypothetical protein AVEN_70258-1 [Araneus ventricosus]
MNFESLPLVHSDSRSSGGSVRKGLNRRSFVESDLESEILPPLSLYSTAWLLRLTGLRVKGVTWVTVTATEIYLITDYICMSCGQSVNKIASR